METVTLGKTETPISAIGLGGMSLSIQGRPTEVQSIQVIHRALDLGVTLIDTADAYCLDESDKHHNEKLIAKALKSYPGDTSAICVATKGGLMRPKGDWTCNGDPQHLKKTIQESFAALGGERPIALWQFHAPDDHWSVTQSLQAVKEVVEEGLIRHVGVSNFSVAEIQEAQQVLPIVSVQNQYNPWCRNPERDGVLAYCAEQGMTFLPWSPLGGSRRVSQLAQHHALVTLAQERQVTPAQLILAWLRAKSSCVVPIPGASRVSSIEDSVAVLKISLDAAACEKIDQMSIR